VKDYLEACVGVAEKSGFGKLPYAVLPFQLAWGILTLSLSSPVLVLKWTLNRFPR
jgi:hypothetical protein